MLTENQIRKLERLKHHATRYEVALTLPSGAQMLVCYTPRKNKTGLLIAMQERGEKILAQMPEMPEDCRVSYDRALGFMFGNGARVHFTGKTQRDSILTGELPFIGACNDWAITSKAENGPAFAVSSP
jgi:hypothetical protein